MREQLSNRLIGYRVKAAREAAGWTQDQLATALDLKDRQSISDIENGKRRVQADELVTLSDALNREMEFFLDAFSVAGEAQFNWRASTELSEASLDAFELRAGSWIGLLRWLRDENSGRVNPLKHSLRLCADSTFEDAEARAEDLASTLELGTVPAERLIESIEQKLDIPVLFVDTVKTVEGYSISGATCHLHDMGAILINRNEVESRRFFDLAHELFHALTWDAMQPEHRESNSFEERGRTKRVEQLANKFAAALLMPATSLDQMIDMRRIEDVDYLASIAAEMHVAPASLAWRLLNMGRIGEVTCAGLKAKRQISSTSATPKRLSSRFVTMLHSAIDRGSLSSRKAAKALNMTLAQLADLFSEHSLSVPFAL